MSQILVYGDSLSWGIIPGTRRRFEFHQRWPGVMELELMKVGASVRVIEDCLNGRRTVWNDPAKPGRQGIQGIQQRIEVNSPLALVILFLGVNDFQSMHQNSANDSANGLREIVAAIRTAPLEPGMPTPGVLLMAPPEIQEPKGSMASTFENAKSKSAGLKDAIEKAAIDEQCHFFNAGNVTDLSVVDGVHLDEDQHLQLGKALAKAVLPLV